MDNRNSENEIESLLRELPPIKDQRSMNELYTKVMERISIPEKRKRKKYFWPVFASTALVCVSFLMVFTFLSSGNRLSSQFSDEIATQDMEKSESSSSLKIEQNDKVEIAPDREYRNDMQENTLENDDVTMMSQQDLNAVYASDVSSNEMVVTIGIPDLNAMNIVPISVVVQNEDGKSWVDQYNQVLNQINESDLGLSDYYPYKGSFSLDVNGYLNLNLQTDQPYSNAGSTGENLFLSSLQFLRYQNVDKVYLLENSKQGVYFSHTGLEIYELPITKYAQTGYQLFNTENHEYLTPTPVQYDTIEEAFNEMKKENDIYSLQPTIPQNVSFTLLNREPGQLNVVLDNQVQLTDDVPTTQMIEAILLTAKEFSYQTVQFENTSIDTIGPFHLNEPITVPLAPNRIETTLEK